MIRILVVVFISLGGCGAFVAANAQTSRPDPSAVLKQLLSKRAPRPPLEDKDAKPVKVRSEDFFDEDNPPSDDAPLEDLMAYWSNQAANPSRFPSDRVRERLLEAFIEDPKALHSFVNLFPQTEAASTKVKIAYDKALNNQQLEEFEREKIKKWLLYNSNYFLNELVASANKVKDDADGGYIDNREAVVALSKVNWELAEPLLRRLLSSTHLRAAALANSLFYQHAIKEKDAAAEDRYRNTLKTIASDRNQPAYGRNIAIEILSETTWSGKDDWYLSLFHDETLISPSDGIYAFSPLTAVFDSDLDKWIPIMARMVESKDLAVRSGAALCLIRVPHKKARKDALMPLLPWLSNPKWIIDRFGNRLRLIQLMADVDIPESVPGLLWAVENDDSEFSFDRSYAASSLARYKDPRAGPALKKALTKEKDEDRRRRIIEGLIESQAISDSELLQALEAYANKLTTSAGREEVERYRGYRDEALPVSISIGKYLGRLQNAPDSLVQMVLSRAENLKSSNPALADALLEVAHRWKGRQVDLDMIARIGNGTADLNTITQALERRAALRETLTPELHGLSAETGAPQGIAAVLLESPSLMQGVLSSEDQFAQIALLACARLTLARLPAELVGPLLSSKNSLLVLAAKSYLLIEDSKQAQEILWKHYRDQAFVTGWDQNIEGQPEDSTISKVEEKLRAELFKENGPIEIIAWIHREDFSRVMRIYPDKTIYTHYEDPARFRERTLTQAELSSFKEFLITKGIAELGPQFSYCHHNCLQAQFLNVTKEKGRRVYTESAFGQWMDVLEQFDQFSRGPGAKIHYNFEKDIKGLEVLYADDDLSVKEVWKHSDEIRILVERRETEEEYIARTKSRDSEDDEDEVSAVERWRREVARRKALVSWRVFTNNKAGAVTAEPEIYSTIDASKFPPDEGESSLIQSESAQKLTADSVIIAQPMGGLWKQVAGSKPVRIGGDGGYANPVITPDGKWVVVAKTDSDWSQPNYLVRLNLQTGREFRVNVEPADVFYALAFVEPYSKVLLWRSKEFDDPSNTKSVGPERPEYYLLDAATGETRLLSGEFKPLHHRGNRFLQRTEKPNEFWAAIPDEQKNETVVGRYSLKDFTFKPSLTIPHITFDSMSMWVDEAGNRIYLVYRDQLLRIPLLNN